MRLSSPPIVTTLKVRVSLLSSSGVYSGMAGTSDYTKEMHHDNHPYIYTCHALKIN